jgi:hypothetical protein
MYVKLLTFVLLFASFLGFTRAEIRLSGLISKELDIARFRRDCNANISNNGDKLLGTVCDAPFDQIDKSVIDKVKAYRAAKLEDQRNTKNDPQAPANESKDKRCRFCDAVISVIAIAACVYIYKDITKETPDWEHPVSDIKDFVEGVFS